LHGGTFRARNFFGGEASMESAAWLEKSRLFGDRLPAEMKARWQTIDKIGLPQPYRKTHKFEGEFINASHRKLSLAPTGRMGIPVCIDIGIDGYLQREEALKLYELAYFNIGDAIELGTYRGLSTSIIATALRDGSKGRLETVDNAWSNRSARKNVTRLLGSDAVTFTLRDATKRLDEVRAQGRKVGFMFIDHWHGYNETFEAAERSKEILSPGGFILFHDFLDPANTQPSHPYGVYQAVIDSFGDDDRMQFSGLFGSTALFQMN
jgi:predicted O-methyltransferase YrrM